jgi:hypothetical protein
MLPKPLHTRALRYPLDSSNHELAITAIPQRKFDNGSIQLSDRTLAHHLISSVLC